MSIDLISLVREAITPEAISKLSVALEESPAGTQQALESGVPAILAGMAGKVSNGAGISSLLSIFSSGAPNGVLLRNFGPALNGSGAAALMNFGNAVVQKVLGDNAAKVADAISSQSGVRPSSALSLLDLAGPLAVGAISKASGPQGVTISSLLTILASQRESIVRLLPSGLGGVLGGAQLATVASPVGSTRAAEPPSPPELGGLLRFWPVWALLAALVIGGLIWSINQDSAPLQTAVDAGASTAAKAGSAVPVAVSSMSALGEFSERKLPNGVALNIPQLGIENKLIDFIQGPSPAGKETWFDFDRLLFDTGGATLQPSSQEQLDNIANILKAYPKVKVRLGGYTDNVGSSATNLLLSRERARSVMESLVKAGVAPSRLSSQGYGEIHPVASNDTEEGRARNRRISLRLTAK